MYIVHNIVFLNCCHFTLHFASDLLEESDLDLLTQELRPVQHKWESIGRELSPFGFINADNIRLQYHDDGDRLRAILNDQLQYTTTTKKQLQSYYTITWRSIVDALRSPRVGDPQLADELETKYCPSEFINNNILLYFSEYNVVQHCTISIPHKV